MVIITIITIIIIIIIIIIITSLTLCVACRTGPCVRAIFANPSSAVIGGGSVNAADQVSRCGRLISGTRSTNKQKMGAHSLAQSPSECVYTYIHTYILTDRVYRLLRQHGSTCSEPNGEKVRLHASKSRFSPKGQG